MVDLKGVASVVVLLSVSFSGPLSAAIEEPWPKLGPNAIPITLDRDYLRKAEAPDYWTLSSFYVPQQTSSACSIASVTMAMNGLLGVPPHAEDTLVTQASLLEAVGDSGWDARSAEGGDGVTYAEFETYVADSLTAVGLNGAAVESVRPADNGEAALFALREALATNEASADDIMLVYYNQGVVTGDWDGPHISPIGAYDAETDRVLVMDVDREWYVPYWTPTEILLDAMLRPAPEEHGVLAGETGGYILVGRPE